MSTGAALKRHRSAQDLGTPREFIEAVESRFGPLSIDLAANESNHVCDVWYGPGGLVENSLDVMWLGLAGNGWCNPEFELIPKFVSKAVECQHRPAWTLLLTPASTGANWFRRCEERGYVIELEDRITFVGESKRYPKDLALTAFGFGVVGRGRWHWDMSVKKAYERTPKEPKQRKSRAAKAAE